MSYTNKNPSAAETRLGYWCKEYKSGVKVYRGWVSTCCDMWSERLSRYCPYCGAKMLGVKPN